MQPLALLKHHPFAAVFVLVEAILVEERELFCNS
jgi:hypothetical protein